MKKADTEGKLKRPDDDKNKKKRERKKKKKKKKKKKHEAGETGRVVEVIEGNNRCIVLWLTLSPPSHLPPERLKVREPYTP